MILTKISANVIFSEDFSGFSEGSYRIPTETRVNATGSVPTLDECTKEPGWNGNRVYQAGEAIKLGASGEVGWITTPLIDLSAYGGKFYLSFKAMVANPGDSTVIYIYTDNGSGNKFAEKVEIPSYSSRMIFHQIGPLDITADLGEENSVKVTISGAQINGRIILKDLIISEASPYAKVFSESFKTEVGVKQTKNLDLIAMNLEDDLKISVTNIVGSAFSTDMTTISIEKTIDSTKLSLPVSYQPIDLGRHEAVISITGGKLTDEVIALLSGNSWSAIEFSNLRELKNAYTEENYSSEQVFRVRNDIVMSYSTYNGIYKYFQDEFSGILVYDTWDYTITNEMIIDIGDIVTDLTGTIDKYRGELEFRPLNPIIKTNDKFNINPIVTTIQNIKSGIDTLEARLIRINGLTNMSGRVFWAKNTNDYIFSDGLDRIIIRTQYMTDYWGTTIPEGVFDIVGIALQRDGEVQIFPRNSNDFILPTTTEVNTFSKTKIYVSNSILCVELSPGQHIEIYDVFGRKIISEVADGNISKFNLKNNQIYIVKAGDKVTKVLL